MEIKLDTSNFENEVVKSPVPVLVDFWATWCGPCMMIKPIVEEIAEEYEGKLKVGTVNVDEVPSLAMDFSIDSIPTLLLVKDGKVVSQTKGYMNKEQLKKFLFNGGI